MNNSFKPSWLLLVPLTLWLSSCNKEEQSVAPTIDNESLTTATLQLTNKANSADVVTATVDNLDKSADFSKATLNLKANTTYSGVILLSDKSQTPATDVTAEIKDRQNIHLFVYTPSPTSLLTVTITDKDTNPSPGPYPIGLTYDVKTTTAGTGSLNVVLRHQPNSKNGTATPGSSDLDTTFPVVIK
ncbi:hypothetical protein [Spirosoma aerolatum]|uniref:hypothetical protein n=1 Tax=Spirosoma aerolatum TaxID=1211326 RepID=UPI0009AE312E|nr:hypothetical protein [Spirosoma aerolatum]